MVEKSKDSTKVQGATGGTKKGMGERTVSDVIGQKPFGATVDNLLSK